MYIFMSLQNDIMAIFVAINSWMLVCKLPSESDQRPLTVWDWGGVFSPGWRFFANNFGSNKRTQSKPGDFS